MRWNWEERFFGMADVKLDWKLESIKLAVDALNGNVNFSPCERFADSREYILNFIHEELEFEEVLKELEPVSWKRQSYHDSQTGLIKRDKVEDTRRAKRRKI